MGDVLPAGEPVHLRVDANAPGDATIALYQAGVALAQARGSHLEYDAPPSPAAYHVEISLPDAPGTPPVPWVLSNPVYVGLDSTPTTSSPHAQPHSFMTLYDGGPARGWRIEKSTASDAAINVIGAVNGSQLLLRYAISGTPADSPYAGFAMPVTAEIAAFDRLLFTARADRPMRLSVQLRETGDAAERWRRSVYLDSMRRTIEVAFSEFRPVASANPSHLDLSKIESILFVVDTVNTKAGSNGEMQIDDIRYAR